MSSHRILEPSNQASRNSVDSTVLPTRQQTSIAVDFDRINPYNFSFVVRQTIKEKRYFLKYFQHNDYSLLDLLNALLPWRRTYNV